MTVNAPKGPRVPHQPTTAQPAPARAPETASAATSSTSAVDVGATAPVTTATDRGVGETGGPRGLVDRAGDLAGRGVGKLREIAWDELRAEHSLGTSFESHGVGLGIKVYEKVVPEDKLSALQKRTIERMESENPGKKVRFIETRGLMKPQVGLSRGGIGGVGAAVGFHASAPVEYRCTRPYVFEGDSLRELVNGDNARAVAQVLKDNTIDLPHKAEDLLKLPPGSKMELIGKGTFSTSASVGAGVSEDGSLGPVEWHAGASVRAGVTRTGNATIANTLEVREDNQVYMKNAVIDDKARSAWINANAGLTVDLDGALAEIPGLASSGTLGEALSGGAADAIEKSVRKLAAFHAHANVASVEQRSEVNAFNLDFNDPDARRLFDDTNRLKTKAFSDAAGRPGAGVSEAAYTEEMEGTSRHSEVKLAGKRLFLSRALAQEREGNLVTSEGTTAIMRSGRYERERNVLGWHRKIMGEGVHVTKTAPDGTVEKQDFSHGIYTQNDKTPRDSEVGRLRNFVSALGIEGADKIQPDDNNFLTSFFSSDDNLEITLDAYTSREGLVKIADSTPDQIRAAHRDALATLDPKLRGVPVNDPAARRMALEYAELAEESRMGGGRDDTDRFEREMENLGERYARHLGSDARRWRAEKIIRKHAPVFEASENAVRLFTAAAANRDEGRWTEYVPNIMKEAGFDYDSGTLTLLNLAGRDEMLVHRLEIKSEDGEISLVAEDEGKLRNPMADINAEIANPR